MVHQVPNIIRYTLHYAPDTNINGVADHFFLLLTWSNVSYLKKTEYNYNVYFEIFNQYNFKNYVFVNNDLELVRRIVSIRKKNIVVLHGHNRLWGREELLWILILLRGKKFCKKIIFIIWNGTMLELKKSMKAKIRNVIKSKAFNRFGTLMTISFDDEKKARNNFPHANVITGNTPMDHYSIFNSYKLNQQNKMEKEQKKRIMVSHSAFKHNNHLDTFRLLSFARKENCTIICPLSYGDKEYQEKVIKEGENRFENQFKYYYELLALSEYYKLLASIDIFIAGCEIQSGLHVVYFGLCTGIKMYLRGNNYNFVRDMGFVTNHYDELKKCSYQDFVKPLNKEVLMNNEVIAKRFFNPIEKINVWKKLYSSIVEN